MSGIKTGGDANPKKAVTESANAWGLGGNTIGTDSNKLGTLDDVDVDIIRGAVRFIHLVKGTTTIEDAINLWNKIGFTRDGGFFFQNPLNNTAFRLIWDNINNLNALEFGNGAGDTMAIAADVFLPLQPNLSSLGTDANGKIIAGTGGGGGTQTLTKAQLDTAITNSTLTPGAYYFITGVDVALYGGTTVLLQATSTNTIGSAGYGLFFTPKYAGVGNGVWDGSNTYAIGDTAFWGGYVWENLTGNVGFNVDNFDLDGTDWQKIAYNTTDYNVWWDEIKYSYTDDWITYRGDKFGNVVDGVQYGIGNYGYNPIKLMQWGNVACVKNVTHNSYCVFINSKGSIDNVVTENNNYIISLNIGNSSIFSSILLSSNAFIDSLSLLNNSSFYFVTFLKGSFLQGVQIGNSNTFYNIIIGLNSNIQTIATGDNCNINNISLGTSSSFGMFDLSNNIDFTYITLGNNCIFDLLTNSQTDNITKLTIVDNCTLSDGLNGATTIYQSFAKTIFTRQDDTPRLSYYNNSDVQVILPVDN
jgi:hypothetical protein